MVSYLSWSFVLTLWTLLSQIQAQSEHLQMAKLGVLVDLHEPSLTGSTDGKVFCGLLNVHSYQKLKAIEWAVELINNKSWPGEFSLELAVHDTCGESGIAVSETSRLLKWSKENPQTPLIGLIVIGSRNNEKIIDHPLENLNNENISAVVTSARAASLLLSSHPNVFTTAPDLSSVAEGVVALINQLGASNVAIISSSSQATRKFQRLASSLSITADKVLSIQNDSLPTLQDVVQFLQGEAASVQSVVMLLESTEFESIVGDGDLQANERFQKLVGQKSWILGSVGIDSDLVKDWSSKFQSNFLIMQPRVSINSDFHTYFVDKLLNAIGNDNNKEAIQYVETMYHCHDSTIKKRTNNPLIPPCSNLTRQTLLRKMHPESDIGFILNAVSVYSAALRLAQLACTNNTTSCNNSGMSTEVLAALRSLNLPSKDMEEHDVDATESTVSSSHELEGAQRRINYHGKLISRKYDLLLSRTSGKLSKIGEFSHEEGLVLDVMLGIKLEGGTNMHDASENTSSKSNSKSGVRKGKTTRISNQQVFAIDSMVDMRRMMPPPEMYISRVWAMVAIAVSITGVFISLYILVYVLQRMCDGTLRGNQILGVLLLLGIIMMYSSVVLFVLPPGTLMCNFRVFLPSIATSICFGVLMLKAMQLRSLVALGLGGRVPVLNQFVTLVFIVASQVAVNLQWFFSSHEDVVSSELIVGTTLKKPIFQQCFYSHNSYLYLHSYLGFLIVVVFLYGISVLKIRRNYNEAKWITLASCLSLPIAVAWSVVVHIGPPNFQEPAACAAFITTATVLLFSIFIPKLNTISQQSKLTKKKQTLKSGGGVVGGGLGGPGYTGSISTIFTTLSDRGTLQSHISQQKKTKKKCHLKAPNYSSTSPTRNIFIPPPAPVMPTSNGKSVTYSPRLTTNFFHSSSAATSLARSTSMKTPFFEPNRAGFP